MQIVAFIKNSCCLLFVCLFLPGWAQDPKPEAREEPYHRLAVSLSHAHVRDGIRSDGKAAWTVLGAWGFDYDYFPSPKWGIGLHTDMVLQDFQVEDHLDADNSQKVLERSFPFSATAALTYKPMRHLSLSAGLGSEYAPEETLFLTSFGAEYGWELPKRFEFGIGINYEVKWSAYDTWFMAFVISRKFGKNSILSSMANTMKRLWLKIVCGLLPFICAAQTDTGRTNEKDIIDVYRQIRGKSAYSLQQQAHRDSSKFYFSLLPALASPSGSKGFVTSFMSAFYLGDRRTTTMSNVYFTPYFTIDQQYVLPVRSYIWTRNNNFNFSGDYRFMKYPQVTYGLGAPSPNQEQALLDDYQVRFYQDATAELFPHFALGIGIQVDYYYKIHQKEKYMEGTSDWETYGDSSLRSYTASGTTFNFIYDSRGNTINPEKGWYGKLTFRNNLPSYGSTQQWNSLYADGRKYFRLSPQRHLILALWGLYWSVVKGKATYLDLPSIGWDSYGHTGRGLPRNRFRSTGLLYFEAECRSDISRDGLWGAVGFINVTSPAVMNTQCYRSFHPAGGVGIRLKFDKRTGSNGLFDLGFSQGYWSWYIGLNEYF